MPEIPDEAKERIDEQTRQQTARNAVQRNQRHVDERKFNPSFLQRLQDPDVDSDIHDWLRDEFPSLFSGAHIIGQRSDNYEKQQEYLNRAKAEKFVAEQNTGSLLRRHPDVLATMNGDDAAESEQYTFEMSTDEKRVVRSSMEVATTRQSLAVGARGLRSVTTATSETRTVRKEADDEGGGLLDSATGVFG